MRLATLLVPLLAAVPPRAPRPPVVTDGALHADEWAGAAEHALAPGVTLRVRTAGDTLQLGVITDGWASAYVDAFVLVGEARHNLHASMRTGRRALPPAGWTDGRPATTWDAHPGFRANVHRPDSTRGATPTGYELELVEPGLAAGPLRLAVELRDLQGGPRRLVWPDGATRHDVGTWAPLDAAASAPAPGRLHTLDGDESSLLAVGHADGTVWRATGPGAPPALRADLTDGYVETLRRVSGGAWWLAGEGRLLGSQDDGATWRAADVPAGVAWVDVVVLDGGRLLALGTMPAPRRGVVARSDDAGWTWRVLEPAGAPPDWTARAALAAPGHVVAGSRQGLFTSRDGGLTWLRVHHDSGAVPRHVAAGGSGTVVAVGHDGWLVRGDATGWQRVATGAASRWRAVASAAPGDWLVVGDPDSAGVNALRSTDDGRSWRVERIAGGRSLRDVRVVRDRYAVAGEGGVLTLRPGAALGRQRRRRTARRRPGSRRGSACGADSCIMAEGGVPHAFRWGDPFPRSAPCRSRSSRAAPRCCS